MNKRDEIIDYIIAVAITLVGVALIIALGVAMPTRSAAVLPYQTFTAIESEETTNDITENSAAIVDETEVQLDREET
jgi:hypothetical protein